MHNFRILRLLFAMCVIPIVSTFIISTGIALSPKIRMNDTVASPVPKSGSDIVKSKDASIDCSNISQGYVMCKYTGTSKIAAVQISKDGLKDVYTYYITRDTGYAVLPFTQGDGAYKINVWNQVEGTLYSHALTTYVDVALENEFSPFLYASQIVNFTSDSLAIKQAEELTKGMTTASEKVQAIIYYITTNITYDHKKAQYVKPKYISQPDKTLDSGKGICLDYAVLATAMLRSQGIPTKLIYGDNPEGKYHAWISVFTETWTDYDPTRTAQTKAKMPDNGYTAKYIY